MLRIKRNHSGVVELTSDLCCIKIDLESKYVCEREQVGSWWNNSGKNCSSVGLIVEVTRSRWIWEKLGFHYQVLGMGMGIEQSVKIDPVVSGHTPDEYDAVH